MEKQREIVAREEERIRYIVGEMRATLAVEEEDRQKKDREIADLRAQKLEATGWREKREIDDLIKRSREQYGMRQFQGGNILSQPYFGILELDDDDLGKIGYCLGKQSFFDRRSKALVVDWREAPISRFYYEYEAGEFYEEDIRGKERSGVVKTKRQVDTAGSELRKIIEKGVTLIRREDGSWNRGGDSLGGAVARKEEKDDHRLPEITALISPDQFRAITHPESSTVLLQGGAGSGKTTVGLHRIAYLCYQEKERFKPDRILVVMFNRSLQNYIARVLPQLGIGSGVQVETYHGWANKIFRSARMRIEYSDKTPPGVVRLKKHPLILELINRYLEGLMKKSCGWLLDKPDAQSAEDLLKAQSAPDSKMEFKDFLHLLNTHAGKHETRLLERLERHMTDLYEVLTDRALLETTFAKDPGVKPEDLDHLVTRQVRLRNRNQIDFADAGILLLLMQRKGFAVARPDYAHVMVDEAQDLSEVELTTLLHAADKRQSVTICGDMAQRIKDEVSFNSREGFAGLIRSQQKSSGAENLRADNLVVGFRATRPIMELAWHILGQKPSMTVPRDGEPVRIIRTQRYEESIAETKKILVDYFEKRPKALVALVCRFKADADRVFADLKAAGVPNLRRHERDDFSFNPGIVVTNAHQVKGLEFTAVVVFNPGTNLYRDDPANRMLLHVVATRASDHLWIVGHEQMAYGIGPVESEQ